jgi:hypothetical protein
MLKDWRENLHLLPRPRLQRASPTAPLQLLHPAAPVQWTLQHKRTPKNWTIVWVHHVGLKVVQSIVTWPHYCLLAIVLEPTMSSSLNFGSRIKSLHSENVTDSVGSTSICDASPDNVYNLEPGGLKHRTTSTDITWPSEEQAHDLLNTVLASIGSLQHLIDPRSFSDKLCSFYEDDSNRTGIDDLCYIEILMVFALGELLQGKMEEGSTFPGATYFLEAVSCLPSLCDLRKSGTLAIEIMGLFAFFLQCSDRKDDAYVYVSYLDLVS